MTKYNEEKRPLSRTKYYMDKTGCSRLKLTNTGLVLINSKVKPKKQTASGINSNSFSFFPPNNNNNSLAPQPSSFSSPPQPEIVETLNVVSQHDKNNLAPQPSSFSLTPQPEITEPCGFFSQNNFYQSGSIYLPDNENSKNRITTTMCGLSSI